jgi:hypothetical protein
MGIMAQMDLSKREMLLKIRGPPETGFTSPSGSTTERDSNQ